MQDAIKQETAFQVKSSRSRNTIAWSSQCFKEISLYMARSGVSNSVTRINR